MSSTSEDPTPGVRSVMEELLAPRSSTHDHFDLTDRVAVISGGAGLLGKEFARTLASAGATVAIADIRGREAEEVADTVASAAGRPAVGIGMDVTEKGAVEKGMASVQARFGRLDILLNSAALDPKFDPANAALHTQGFEGYPLEAWQKSVDTDLTGAFLASQAVAPIMKAQNRGVIVNVSSIYGVVGPDQRLYERDDGARGYKPPVYSATKAALDGFTRFLATYFAGTNIRVNTLTLGGVYNGHDEEFVRRYAARVPMGRMMTLEDVGSPLLFLVSDASSYMTGAHLVVDGGRTAW
jgi:NAD(P)-dependent dehydrogenase (short-subunit alcohol dehydrogenase family)